MRLVRAPLGRWVPSVFVAVLPKSSLIWSMLALALSSVQLGARIVLVRVRYVSLKHFQCLSGCFHDLLGYCQRLLD